MAWLITANYIVVVLLLLVISVQDITSRLISNQLVIIVGIACCSLALLTGHTPNLLLFAAVLVPGFFLCIGNIIGGGDVKLMSMLALLFTPSLFSHFLILTALCGGVIAVVGLIFFYKKTRQHGIPYGVAISLAFIFSYSTN
ncbi:hypothetical protein PMPD1_3710 [Paramixta manurensis]|uniref:Prepilin type IV endopeptidase peptidase domain-containing protein n=1 Tax=Paramixta manurensis TaxID=2740817 RepID=A0A6M8UG70_9GAMM|nr:hypothetical protein PMPD1_3710 [Erwiniaceae bacterium PD-1]